MLGPIVTMEMRVRCHWPLVNPSDSASGFVVALKTWHRTACRYSMSHSSDCRYSELHRYQNLDTQEGGVCFQCKNKVILSQKMISFSFQPFLDILRLSDNMEIHFKCVQNKSHCYLLHTDQVALTCSSPGTWIQLQLQWPKPTDMSKNPIVSYFRKLQNYSKAQQLQSLYFLNM